MRLTVADGLAIGLCSKGQRRFCRTHGIDFRRFAKEGIPAEELAHIEDANLAKALRIAEDREAKDGRRR